MGKIFHASFNLSNTHCRLKVRGAEEELTPYQMLFRCFWDVCHFCYFLLKGYYIIDVLFPSNETVKYQGREQDCERCEIFYLFENRFVGRAK